jgi:hypothetical protein
MIPFCSVVNVDVDVDPFFFQASTRENKMVIRGDSRQVCQNELSFTWCIKGPHALSHTHRYRYSSTTYLLGYIFLPLSLCMWKRRNKKENTTVGLGWKERNVNTCLLSWGDNVKKATNALPMNLMRKTAILLTSLLLTPSPYMHPP